MSERSARFKYFPELDGLRGVAVLIVMLAHFATTIFRGAWIGVDIFFVISGFLITSLLIKEYETRGAISFKSFYIRRGLRLLPALVALFLSLSVLMLLFFGGPNRRHELESGIVALMYMSDIARAHGRYMGLFAHTWSLSIEEKFYLLWPLTLSLLLGAKWSRRQLSLFVVVCALLVAAYRSTYCFLHANDWSYLLYSPFTRFDSLLVGCFLGIVLLSDLESSAKRIVKFLAWPSFAGLLYLACTLDSGKVSTYYFGLITVAVLASLLITVAVCLPESLFSAFLRNKQLVTTGRISYGLYLFHFPIGLIVEHILGDRIRPLPLIGLKVSLSFVVAGASYVFLEQRFLRLKERFGSVGRRPEGTTPKPELVISGESATIVGNG